MTDFLRTVEAHKQLVRRARKEGIPIDARWKANVLFMIEEMGEAPSEKHTLRCINQAAGFFKYNCHWFKRFS